MFRSVTVFRSSVVVMLLCCDIVHIRSLKCYQCNFLQKEYCSAKPPREEYLKDCPAPVVSARESSRTICGVWTFINENKKPGFVRQCLWVDHHLPHDKDFLDMGSFEKKLEIPKEFGQYKQNVMFVCSDEGCNDNEVVYDYEKADIKYTSRVAQKGNKS